MITIDVHSVKSISARARSHGLTNNWVTMRFEGPSEVFEVTAFFDEDQQTAEAYAQAINSANATPGAKVDEQEAA